MIACILSQRQHNYCRNRDEKHATLDSTAAETTQVESRLEFAFKVVTAPERVTKRAAFKPATTLALQSVRYHMRRTTEIKDDSSWTYDKYGTDTRTGEGPMACFETYEQAKSFASSTKIRGSTVLFCIVERSEQAFLWKRNPPSFSCGPYRGSGPTAHCAGVTTLGRDHDLPAGTILCKRVIPIRVCE